MFALRPDTGVLVLGVIQQTLQEGLDEGDLHGGHRGVFEHPPQHPLRHQSDVTRLVLKTLRGHRDEETSRHK